MREGVFDGGDAQKVFKHPRGAREKRDFYGKVIFISGYYDEFCRIVLYV